MSHAELEAMLAEIELQPSTKSEPQTRLWLGSIGYETFQDVGDFARHLRHAGAKRLIDVRELPISRRRGFAKSALSEALADEGIEYVHIRRLGNPKPLRDLYKSGRVAEGRERYSQYLLERQRDELGALQALLKQKRSVLMCVEREQSVCHRDVIIEALQAEFNLQLDVITLA